MTRKVSQTTTRGAAIRALPALAITVVAFALAAAVTAPAAAQPADDAKPAPAEVQPAPAEVQPAAGEAQPVPAEAPPAAGDAKPAAGDAKPAKAPPPAGDYRSPMRDQCMAELRKDEAWRTELRNQIRDLVQEAILRPKKDSTEAALKAELEMAVHKEDAAKMTRNREHVVYAYAALWILMAGFVVFMWMRQRRLTDEIERLERDIQAASGEG